jgi:uncharacterized protein (TIGR00369 family)
MSDDATPSHLPPPLSPERAAEILSATRDVPCLQTLRFEALDLRDGYVRLGARNDPRFNSKLPGVHGGILAYIADCAAWYAIASRAGPRVPMVTSDLHIRYLAPCLSDDVIAIARLFKLGRTLCPVHVELQDAHGVLAAVADVCYMRLDAAAPRR